MKGRALALGALVALLGGCGRGPALEAGVPECEPSGELVTVAQAVPTARFVPCIDRFPLGWSFGGTEVRDGRARFWLDNDRVGAHAVRVTLEATCDTTGATELPEGGRTTKRSLRLDQLGATSEGTWFHEFGGGCVTYDFRVPTGTYDFDAFNVEMDAALSFFSRGAIAEEVERRYDAELDDAALGT